MPPAPHASQALVEVPDWELNFKVLKAAAKDAEKLPNEVKVRVLQGLPCRRHQRLLLYLLATAHSPVTQTAAAVRRCCCCRADRLLHRVAAAGQGRRGRAHEEAAGGHGHLAPPQG